MITEKKLMEFLGGMIANCAIKFGLNQVQLPAGATITLAAGATNSINATIQLKDGAGNNLARIQPVEVFITDEAAGAGPLTSAAPSGALTASTGQILTALTAKKHVKAMTDATGALVLNLVDTGKVATIYFHVALPLTSESINSVVSGSNWG